jgi:hypothetical protein
MHLHLVTFQVVGRTPFDANAYAAAYGGPNGVPGGIDPTPFATLPMQAPAPEERGFKDTAKANPGAFTTIRAKFELPAGGQHAAALRAPLPHRRIRGQRHDAAVHRRPVTTQGARVGAAQSTH